MQKKILLTYFFIIILAVIIIGAMSLSLLQTNYLVLLEDKLISNSNIIKENLILYDNYKKVDYANLAKHYSKAINARVTFIDKFGNVIGDSDIDYRNLDNHNNRPEVKDALKGNIGKNKRYSSTLKKDLLYVAIPYKRKDSILSVIRLAIPIDDIRLLNKKLLNYIVVSIITGLAVALMIGYRFVKTFTEPIKELTKATKKILRGNYGEKVFVNSNDEIGILADNFNIMSEKLQLTISEIEEKNSKTRAILTSMINGVIALDNNKKIVFVNPVIESLLGVNEIDLKSKDIFRLINDYNLDRKIENLFDSNRLEKIEIEIFMPNYKIVNVYSNSIYLNKDINRKIGTVLIFEDITEIRKFENMRRDFVANVSHELKTPLTSIRGFIETLRNGAIEVKGLRNKFLEIIDIEAERLYNLIEDILVLSEIESKGNMTSKEKIIISHEIKNTLSIMNEIAKKKNVLIKKDIDKNLPILYGNKTWFKQMLINLIDNAIKYNKENGKVLVKVTTNKNEVIIKVIDTGIGISEEHLSRLFERFYRVEKARTRQVEGTGLGLAIVKHIVMIFNGNIEVDSKVNKGTEFTITLPINNN